ncbi:hypothetical protein B0O99DRAFT_598632 [Bisporella sp. PMI_857]|nr:hypothetical protein B0O99DRAFT_598632 [Bisporella sp. PMI_857]
MPFIELKNEVDGMPHFETMASHRSLESLDQAQKLRLHAASEPYLLTRVEKQVAIERSSKTADPILTVSKVHAQLDPNAPEQILYALESGDEQRRADREASIEEEPGANGTALPCYAQGSRLPAGFELIHQTHADKKTQHFARTFLVCLVSATDKDLEIGQAHARYLDRSLAPLRHSVHKPGNLYQAVEELNEGESDALAFAKDLFCASGSLNSDIVKDGGPFGQEMAKGAVLILAYLYVGAEYRRRGLASVLLLELIRKANATKGGLSWMVVKPGVIDCIGSDFWMETCGLDEEEKKAVKKEHYDQAVRFYRSFGFRRIARSKWFALSMDPEHGGYSVGIEDDLEAKDT